jgi:sigma-B regulation protein RsbU (phosphoserine phosphatase)
MHFMKTVMDTVEYTFDEVNGTILTMTKVLDVGETAPPPEIERELQVFEEVGWALNNARDVNELLDLIVTKLTEVVDADRGTLYLIDDRTGELVSKVLHDTTGRLGEIRLKIGQGIAGRVAETGETVNIFSTKDNPYFARTFDQTSGYVTRNMICTPMRDASKQVIGVIQLLNKRQGIFTPRDETILKVLASEAAIAIENARLLASEQSKRELADTLREVTSIINSALELQEVLDLILQELERVIPYDGGAILLTDGEDMVIRSIRGYTHQNAVEVVQARPFKVSQNVLFQELVASWEPIIIPDVEEDSRWIKLSTTVGMHSWMGVPLIVEDQVIGELGITSRHINFYTEEHAEVAQAFANQAAASIERARLYQQTIMQARLQQEVETAKKIQTSFLPEFAPSYPGWDIAASWQPAQEVAGDFYDFFNLPDGRIGFVVADVCGKGIPAALFMALSRTIFRVLAVSSEGTPDRLLEEVNNQIRADNRANLFVTLFYGILDPLSGELHYCNGGHNPPVFVSNDGGYKMIEAGGTALGIFANVPYQAEKLILQPGDVLVAYTDGVTEAINRDEDEYGEDKLMECIYRNRQLSAEEISLAIATDVFSFAQGLPAADDATVVVIKCNN